VQDGGSLSEFFSEEPNAFARGSGDGYEWPYTWRGEGTFLGGGYDWLGSETSMRARGLDMPPDRDIWGPKYVDW
jgi:hypothetical protein